GGQTDHARRSKNVRPRRSRRDLSDDVPTRPIRLNSDGLVLRGKDDGEGSVDGLGAGGVDGNGIRARVDLLDGVLPPPGRKRRGERDPPWSSGGVALERPLEFGEKEVDSDIQSLVVFDRRRGADDGGGIESRVVTVDVDVRGAGFDHLTADVPGDD